MLALLDMPWPLKKEDALEKVFRIGSGCEDLLIRLSTEAHEDSRRGDSSKGDEAPKRSAKRSDGDESAPPSDAGIGLAYWAWHALTRIQVSRSAKELSGMRSAVHDGDGSSSLIERGAMLLVSGFN